MILNSEIQFKTAKSTKIENKLSSMKLECTYTIYLM